MKLGIIKYLVLGALLLSLFHFESQSLGPVKISHLWKGAVLLYLIFCLIRKTPKGWFIYKPLFVLAILQIINVEFFYNLPNAIVLFGTTLIIPLLGIFLLKFSIDQLKNALLFFSSFFILSFIPYQLGIIESLGEGYDLSNYGLDSEGLVGPFQGVHSASIALASSFIVVFYFWLRNTFNRAYLLILMVLCSFFLINTYVRTGIAMIVLGSLPLIIYFSRRQSSLRLRLIFISILFSIIASFWVFNNQILINRIKGEGKYSKENTVEKVGSGRGLIYMSNLEIFEESSLIEKIFGIGPTQLISRTKKKINRALLPHNAFLQVILSNGIFGVFFLFAYIISLYNLKKIMIREYFVLIFSLLIAFIVMSFVQNYDILYFHIIMMISITLYVKESYSIKDELRSQLNEIPISKSIK